MCMCMCMCICVCARIYSLEPSFRCLQYGKADAIEKLGRLGTGLRYMCAHVFVHGGVCMWGEEKEMHGQYF